MQFLSRHSRATRGTIAYLPVDDIHSSAVQPRQNFSPSQLEELAASIGEYGVLNPLTVRQRPEGYELVAGERRLRAAKLAGLVEVPCIVMELNMEEASLIALVENLQRRDLDFIEEARGIAQLIRLFGMSQEECARRLGKSQSAAPAGRRFAGAAQCGTHRAARPGAAASEHAAGAARRAGVHHQPRSHRCGDGCLCRAAAGSKSGARPGKAKDVHSQGRARVSQHALAQP